MTTKRRVLAIAISATLCAALIVAFSLLEAAVSGLGGGVAHFSLNGVSGPGALNEIGQWAKWDTVDGQGPGPYIGAHLALDLVFIAAYGLLLFALIDAGRVRPDARDDLVAGAATRRRILTWLLGIVLAIDLLEDIGLLIGAFRIGDGLVTPELAIGIAVVTLVKWCSLAVLVLFVVGHLVVTLVQRRPLAGT